MNNSGLTLLEALLGLAILAISVLALIQLQQGTFSADAYSSASRTAQRLAENELAAQLATPGAPTGTCLTQNNINELNNDTNNYTCETRSYNCGITTTPHISLDCSSTAPNPPTHQLITVTLTTPHGPDLTLSTLRQAN